MIARHEPRHESAISRRFYILCHLVVLGEREIANGHEWEQKPAVAGDFRIGELSGSSLHFLDFATTLATGGPS